MFWWGAGLFQSASSVAETSNSWCNCGTSGIRSWRSTPLNERLSREARSEGIDACFGSAENPPNHLRTGSFGAVFLNGDLSTVHDPKAAIQNARRLLEPGGYLLAEVPNHGSYSARRLGPPWYLWEAGIRINYFTTKSLSRLIEEGGCDIKEIVYRRYIAQFTREQMRDEQERWDRLYSNSKQVDRNIPPRKSSIRSRLDFARTIFVPLPAGKYPETVGIIST